MVVRAWPLVVVTAILCFTPAHSRTCAPGVDTPGVTIPEGDIVLEHGKALEIACVINTTHKLSRGRDARSLRFYENGKLISKEKVQLINSTTAKLNVMPEPSTSLYTCKLQRKQGDEVLVCANMVTVGYKPRPVKEFSCISENWMNLNCSWKEQENPIQTKYKLTYQLPGPLGGRNLFACPGATEKYHYCVWNLTTQPVYRRYFKVYYFRMFGTNALGTVAFEKITFRHYAHVIPAKPDMLTYLNVTVSSAQLQWRLPFPISEFPPGLVYRIQYKVLCDSSNEWEDADTSKLTKNASTFTLKNLKYANSDYEVKVFIRSREATSEWMWSEPASVTFRTKADVPMYPPKVSQGSFQVFKKQYGRDITLYWQQIPRCAENGDGFHYKILSTEENGIRKDMKPEYVGKSYAKFKNLSFNGYKFEIVSSNIVGDSYKKAILLIPSEMDRPPEPTALTKYVTQRGTLQLSWNPVSSDIWSDRIKNYTIFWCQNEYEVPNHCMGILHWTYSDEGTRQVTLPITYGPTKEIAISSNTDYGSSGMIWATCLLHSYDELIKAKEVYVNAVSSTTLEVGFYMECVNHIENIFYSINYCPFSELSSSVCEAPKNKTVKSDALELATVITGLLPYTTYIVYVIPVIVNAGTVTKQGESSNIIHKTTLESAPSKPREVIICCITNESFSVLWKPPLHINGVLRHYQVNYNNKTITIGPKEDLKAKIQELESFVTYSVSVSACTTICSNFSDPVNITTGIGAPGTIKDVAVTMRSESVIDLKWEAPAYKGGNIDYYEIKVISSRSYSSPTLHPIISSRDNKKIIHVGECQKGSTIFHLAVRAVNLDESNNIFHGPWSEMEDVVCTSVEKAQNFHPIIWTIMAVAVVLFCFVVFNLLKRLISWWNLAQKIQVKLPPGLTHYIDQDNDYHKATTWLLKSENKNVSHELLPATDQQIFLPIGFEQQMKVAAIKIIDYPSDQLSDNQLPRLEGSKVTIFKAKVMESLSSNTQAASKSLEQLQLRRHSSHLSMTYKHENKSASKSLPNLSECVETTTKVDEWRLKSYITEELNADDDIYFDNYSHSVVEEEQMPKLMPGYVSTTFKSNSLVSLSELSSVSSVSYELPGHGTIFKDLLYSLSSQDSISSKNSQNESEMNQSVTSKREDELKNNRKYSVVSEEKEIFLQTRTKFGPSVSLLAANIHSSETYCHIGLNSEMSEPQHNQTEKSYQHIQLFNQKGIEYETHSIKFQLEMDYDNIFDNEDLCLSLSSCSSSIQLNDLDKEELPAITSNNYVSSKAAGIVKNTD